MSARDDVLARVRSARSDAAVPDVPRDYARTGRHAPGSAELLELLTERLLDYKATVVRTDATGVPGAVAAALRDAAPVGDVVVPAGLPAGWVPAGRPDDGFTAAQLDACAAVVTGCAAAAAVTGTIVLDAGPDQGRRALTLVPDVHVCVVRQDQVVDSVPELVARLDPLRPLTFISGPSATSDIELNRVEGVHGPRTLVVVLVVDDQAHGQPSSSDGSAR